MFGSVNNVVEPFAQEIEGVDDIKLIQEENDYMDAELVSLDIRIVFTAILLVNHKQAKFIFNTKYVRQNYLADLFALPYLLSNLFITIQ